MKKLLFTLAFAVFFISCKSIINDGEYRIVESSDGLYEVHFEHNGNAYVVEYDVTYEDAIEFIKDCL